MPPQLEATEPTASSSSHTTPVREPAIEPKNLTGAEMLLREMGSVTLLEALDYVALLAELRPAKAPRAAVRWQSGGARDAAQGSVARARRNSRISHGSRTP